MIAAYLNFMLRARAQRSIPTAFEMVPDFYFRMSLWGAMFIAAMAAAPFLLKHTYPEWFKTLNDRKREELPAYLTSMIHHLTVVPLAWYCIYKDFQVTDPNNPLEMEAFITFAAPFCVGFVVADTFFYALPLCFRGNFEYVIHHALAFWMTYALLSSSGHLIRYFPHIIICDTTNGVFNTAWMLRLTGHKDSPLVTFLEIAFAVLFFFLRIINLSVVFYIMFTSPDGAFGVGKWVFPMISMLQFYWLTKIAQALFKKFLPAKDKDSKAPRAAKKVE